MTLQIQDASLRLIILLHEKRGITSTIVPIHSNTVAIMSLFPNQTTKRSMCVSARALSGIDVLHLITRRENHLYYFDVDAQAWEPTHAQHPLWQLCMTLTGNVQFPSTQRRYCQYGASTHSRSNTWTISIQPQPSRRAN
jgi:hypothetical protein